MYLGFGGVEILSLEDDQGRLLRRSRKGRDGRENVLIDNRQYYRSRARGGADIYVDLPAPSLRIARDKYIVDYDEASEEDLYEALSAPPVERLDRGYSMEEVRYGHGLRERMRRVDLDAITFAFGSWEVDEGQYFNLERAARVIKRILKRNPDEMFLIEGHTDAVGSDIDNLSLSDRRAELVAIILSDEFQVPPENLTTQGYGEQYLKELTNGPSRAEPPRRGSPHHAAAIACRLRGTAAASVRVAVAVPSIASTFCTKGSYSRSPRSAPSISSIVRGRREDRRAATPAPAPGAALQRQLE